MSILLRLLLITGSFFTTLTMLLRIRQSKTLIEDSVFWILLSVSLVVLSVFPGLAIWFATVIGFDSPVNFVFLFIIFILLLKLFNVTIRLSQLDDKLKQLTQSIALSQSTAPVQNTNQDVN